MHKTECKLKNNGTRKSIFIWQLVMKMVILVSDKWPSIIVPPSDATKMGITNFQLYNKLLPKLVIFSTV